LGKLFVKDIHHQEKFMYKIIIQPAQKIGFYQVILMQQQHFYFIKWWKDISFEEYEGDIAFLKLTELINRYDIQSGEVYDWSGDGFDLADVKKAS
jgi:hypothetical protein